MLSTPGGFHLIHLHISYIELAADEQDDGKREGCDPPAEQTICMSHWYRDKTESTSKDFLIVVLVYVYYLIINII